MDYGKYDFQKDWRFIKSSGAVDEEVVEFIEELFQLMEVRRRVGAVKGIVFEIRSNEGKHTVPHVHARYGEYNVSIAIESGIPLEGNLPPKQKKYASEWVCNHKEKLLSDWKNYSINATSIMTKSKLEPI